MVISEVGGGSDFTARLIAIGLSANWGHQVIVDNRPSGVIPGRIVSKSAPDGYTLLCYGGTFWLGPLLQDKLGVCATIHARSRAVLTAESK